VGDDALGVRVLQELHELDVAVVVVCVHDHGLFARAAQAAEVPLVVGDPLSEETLRAAGIETARACALLGDSNLANLHVALEVEELAPEARLVMRLFNTSLAGPVRELIGDVAVLSASELAAPAFVEAALRGSAGLVLHVGDHQATVQEVDVGDPRLRLALAESEAGPRAPAVPRRRRPCGRHRRPRAPGGQPGVRLCVPRALELRIARRQAGLATTAARLYRASWLVLRGLVGVMDRRLAVVAVAFPLILAASALVFDDGLSISLLDAFYFAVTTVMSVGYGEINLLEASPALSSSGRQSWCSADSCRPLSSRCSPTPSSVLASPRPSGRARCPNAITSSSAAWAARVGAFSRIS